MDTDADKQKDETGEEEQAQPPQDEEHKSTDVSTQTTAETSDKLPEQSRIRHLCEKMFEKTTDYLQGELTSTSDEYRLLERLNKLTIAKYADMSTLAATLTTAMSDMNEKYKNLEPYLEQVEQLEASVSTLEQAAYRLDAYSKRLEAKFKQLEKK
ncbi:biogenesis of lysosome-related organelles complex 1 subunit 2-like [Corticium candelabrum]|uniref:biogenesis of lysosome-related organelles complex 1 subunit 2-like n=1 Tax=Corticium candelabrum TaxID=121492 RepID=UPI002E2753ED|nr:biogenesis of lysosome-related organelles complex 1 subunit 2-like [Corticium candelabrum]